MIILLSVLACTRLSSSDMLPETLVKSFYWTILRYGNIGWGHLNVCFE